MMEHFISKFNNLEASAETSKKRLEDLRQLNAVKRVRHIEIGHRIYVTKRISQSENYELP